MKFTIGFDQKDKEKIFASFEEIVACQKWTEAKFTQAFEEKWAAYHDSYAVAFSSWSGAALAALEYYNLRNRTVLCPSNTFMATPLVNMHLGCTVEFVDCNRFDLCMSFDDLKKKIKQYKPSAVWLVHIGGHIAFEVNEITAFCKKEGIIVLEDCAHAHGASWNKKRAGIWADAGIYSLYATKTITTGEGGVLITKDKKLIEFAKQYRNYGKFDYQVQGLNFRMSEFTAAIGCVEIDRLDSIVGWKNDYAKKYLDPKFQDRVKLPEGMISGYYKYIIFDEIEKSTGKVYDQPCHHILKKKYRLPNTEWVANHHWCVPLYYKGNEKENCP